MNGKELYSAPVSLNEFGIQQAFYLDEGEVKFATTEKGVKLFCLVEDYPNRRINFWFPKSFLIKSDDHYTHIKFGGIERLKECKQIAINEHIAKWEMDKSCGKQAGASK